ncbi:hypothetical protein [Oryza sativa Japonica Group]|uniref:Uncharacterized protein n=1 Tax=Oryza sativa subsp. japonica TaxID=39947 RepID=Q656T7_ORYSJ|nr:hypothetical protein [Oryza sativa Japonica Group]
MSSQETTSRSLLPDKLILFSTSDTRVMSPATAASMAVVVNRGGCGLAAAISNGGVGERGCRGFDDGR